MGPKKALTIFTQTFSVESQISKNIESSIFDEYLYVTVFKKITETMSDITSSKEKKKQKGVL